MGTAIVLAIKNQNGAFILMGTVQKHANSSIKYEFEIDSWAIKELKGMRGRRVDHTSLFSKKDKNRKALLKKFKSKLKKDIKRMFYKKPVVKIQKTHRRR